jgi:hypothetical protein
MAINRQMRREQGESDFWARIIMHMPNMYISIIMLLLTVVWRI